MATRHCTLLINNDGAEMPKIDELRKMLESKHIDLNITDGTRDMSTYGTRFTNSRLGTERSGYGGTARGVSQ